MFVFDIYSMNKLSLSLSVIHIYTHLYILKKKEWEKNSACFEWKTVLFCYVRNRKKVNSCTVEECFALPRACPGSLFETCNDKQAWTHEKTKWPQKCCTLSISGPASGISLGVKSQVIWNVGPYKDLQRSVVIRPRAQK